VFCSSDFGFLRGSLFGFLVCVALRGRGSVWQCGFVGGDGCVGLGLSCLCVFLCLFAPFFVIFRHFSSFSPVSCFFFGHSL
jgi:hypothetical protein